MIQKEPFQSRIFGMDMASSTLNQRLMVLFIP